MNMKDTLAGSATVERSEGEAIVRARSGDAGAFEYLYKAHCRHVYSVCLRMTRNPAEAEDLTQQTFLQVFRKIGTFRGESGFSTWLHRVTVNIVLMHLRRRKRTEVPLEDLGHPGSDEEAPREFGAGDTSMFGAIDRLNLRRAIRKLPSGYKRFFLLYDFFGYEHHEIAQRLGCSAGCSKSQLHRARRQLRRLLQGERRVAREANVAAA
jgi:RNA polymerase sigma-70 factor (ECF subfamily)